MRSLTRPHQVAPIGNRLYRRLAAGLAVGVARQAGMSVKNERIRQFFGDAADQDQHLNGMKNALVQRIEVEKAEFRRLENLQQFVATRANQIILTDPRPVEVFDPPADLDALFKELVE